MKKNKVFKRLAFLPVACIISLSMHLLFSWLEGEEIDAASIYMALGFGFVLWLALFLSDNWDKKETESK
ncbi:hypothetical protein [Tenacibaculum sp. 190524A05c]|uniref:Uncharacterized protein n=1 Tax=Tenacibaculum platacis TaxID=3137852 RepID=A0ABM9P0E9_9FLAO